MESDEVLLYRAEAAQAYASVGHTGSSGLHLPADVRAYLAELRRLLNGS